MMSLLFNALDNEYKLSDRNGKTLDLNFIAGDGVHDIPR